MAKHERSGLIRQHLYVSGYSTVAEISEAVGASVATVRRDLLEMEREGTIFRDHGGAEIAVRSGTEVGFEVREAQNLSAKRAIAEEAFGLIAPHSTIFLDAGTTVYQLARRLTLNPMPLTVFSNCIPIAQELMSIDGINVTLIGGRVRHENASMVGPLAETAIEALWFDNLFLGAGGIASDGYVYSADADEARLNAKMLGRASQKQILVDSSKFDRQLTYQVATASDAHIITDASLSAEWEEKLKAQKCDFTRVQIGTTH